MYRKQADRNGKCNLESLNKTCSRHSYCSTAMELANAVINQYRESETVSSLIRLPYLKTGQRVEIEFLVGILVFNDMLSQIAQYLF